MLLDIIWMCVLALQLVLPFQIAQSQSIVKSLPGYDGPLPVKLETGYIGVGKKEEIQLFYYFMESERNVETDPLLIWFCGGPGCSVLSSMMHQIGPFEIDIKKSISTSIRLRPRKNSWTQISNMLLFDAPVDTGFSYSTTPEGYLTSETKSVKNYYEFIQKWLVAHPQFLNNRLFIGGDSYAGKIVPPVTYEIVKGNEAGQNPKMLLQGYLIGNPAMHRDFIQDQEAHWQFNYANRMGLVSDKYIEQAKKTCGERFVNQYNTTACAAALDQIHLCLKNTNYAHILEPTCALQSLSSNYPRHINYQEDDDTETGFFCRKEYAELSPAWANLPSVQKALHVREGTIGRWLRCNRSIDNGYERDVENAYSYHKILSTKPLQALVYSGDHDLTIPWLLTLDWVQRLNMTISENWRPWIVDGQISGYTLRYKYPQTYSNFVLTFATVKGGGHAPQHQRSKECLAMVDRWFSLYPL